MMKSRQLTLNIAIGLGLFCTSPCVKAQDRFVDGLNVVIKEGLDFKIGQQWSNSAKAELIGGKNVDTPSKIMGFIATETPMSAMRLAVNNAGAFRKMGTVIAKECQKKHPENFLIIVSCLANSVQETFKQTRWPDWFSFCRAHATAFRAAFDALDWPRSHVKDTDSGTSTGGHVVSQFQVTSKAGQVFSYVIDVGNLPTKIFPANELTEQWHKNNPETQLPVSLQQPVYEFKPAPKAIK